MSSRFSVVLANLLAVLTLGLAGTNAAAAASTEIELWHTMKGAAAESFARVVERFNAEQSEVRVLSEYKGGEAETVAAAIAAGRAKKAGPHLLQVADVHAGVLWAARGTARPLHQVLALSKSPDFNFFLPATTGFMKDSQGQLYGFPFQASVPVLFYNKDAYRKAGLDPDKPPLTWRDLQAHLLALKAPDSGVTCAYTTSDQAWIHVENLGAWHGEPIATRNNGLDGPGALLTFNGLLHVRHTALMMSWVKAQLFSYGGRHKEGDARFLAGECATLSAASGALADLMQGAQFEFGVAPMPFHEEGTSKPVGSMVGGSSLWVMAGKKPAEYVAVAKFLAFFSTPVIAAAWHQQTGTLPLTNAAYQASEKTGFYDRISGLGPLMKSAAGAAAPATRGVRLPRYDQVRDVMDSQLEAVWNGSKAAKQGLDDAVRQGNAIMRESRPMTTLPMHRGGSPVPVRTPTKPRR